MKANSSGSQFITVDGPRGTGKSLLAKGLRFTFGCAIVEVGPIFRLVSWTMSRKQIADPVYAAQALFSYIKDGQIKIDVNAGGTLTSMRIHLDSGLTEDVLWQPQLDTTLQKIAGLSEVIRSVESIARYVGNSPRVVVIGREVGARMFPEACLKVALVANVERRKERKISQLTHEVKGITSEYVINNSEPLDVWQPDKDTIEVDTTLITPGDVLAEVVGHVIKFAGWEPIAHHTTLYGENH